MRTWALFLPLVVPDCTGNDYSLGAVRLGEAAQREQARTEPRAGNSTPAWPGKAQVVSTWGSAVSTLAQVRTEHSLYDHCRILGPRSLGAELRGARPR